MCVCVRACCGWTLQGWSDQLETLCETVWRVWDDANLLHTKPSVHTATYVWDPLRTVNKSWLVFAHCTLFLNSGKVDY